MIGIGGGNTSNNLVIDSTNSPYNVVAGSKDMTANIQRALDAAAAAVNSVEGAGPYGLSATVMLPLGYLRVSSPLKISSWVTLQGQGLKTKIFLQNNSNCNAVESVNFGAHGAVTTSPRIKDLLINGNAAGQSGTLDTLAPTTQVTATQTLNQVGATVNVISTTGFAASGSVWIGYNWVTYTGITGTSFTGCTLFAGTDDAKLGSWVTSTDPQGIGIAFQSKITQIENVYVNNTVSHGVYLQGPDRLEVPGLFGAENQIMAGCRFVDLAGVGLYVGQNAPDGRVSGCPVIGGLAGGAVFRSSDWAGSGLHLVGNAGSIEPIPFALLIAAGQFRIRSIFADTYPGTVCMVDANVQGFFTISDLLLDITSIQTPWGASGGGQVVAYRGVKNNGVVQRVDIVHPCTEGPYGYMTANAPYTRLVSAAPATQDLTTAGKIQVLNAMDFAPNSTIGGVLTNATDNAIAYTGKQISYAKLTADAAIGAVSITVDDTTGFDNAGTLTLIAGNPLGASSGSVASCIITYTGKTGTTFTGIPNAGAGSITALIIHSGERGSVAQHFLTGITGALQVAAANNTSLTQTLYQPLVTGLEVSNIKMAGLQFGRFRMQTGDTFTRTGGIQSNKPFRSSGTISVAVGAATAVFAHGLAEAPIAFNVTPTSDLQGKTWFATADATNVTVTLSGNAVGVPITFTVNPECAP